ncbi:DUF1661 domain-containing protein [Porphyromonas gingivalis]|uniref:DUF1661 domain-containing protein n=1 Tax=Porphyromonas gingivalis TaxID=837 RepID=UPI001E3813A6|nr:DUF1661 domain-containing protein [Porphyromonas gingivalis]
MARKFFTSRTKTKKFSRHVLRVWNEKISGCKLPNDEKGAVPRKTSCEQGVKDSDTPH